MPTVTVPSPLSAIHSWVVVYFRRSGNSTASPWQGMTVVRSHAPSVRLPEKLAEQESLRVFLRRGRQGLLSRAPVPHAVLLPESLRGLTPSAPVDDRSLPRTAFGRGESTPVPCGGVALWALWGGCGTPCAPARCKAARRAAAVRCGAWRVRVVGSSCSGPSSCYIGGAASSAISGLSRA